MLGGASTNDSPAPPSERVQERPQHEGFVLPASFAQRRLWFLHQFNPSTPVYNVPAPIRVAMPLDSRVLGRCLNEIARRHEALRTTFTSVDGEPMQVISPLADVPLKLVDLRRIPIREREAEAQRLVSFDAQQPFSLTCGPLFRARLIALGSTDSILSLTLHHIICDGWSIGVLLRELNQLYTAFALRRPPPLRDLPLQYADYAHWQREALTGDRLRRELDYWSRQLGGAPELLDLPHDHSRPTVQTYRGGVHSLALDRRSYAAVKALGQREGATPFMSLLAALKLLLFRYTGDTEVVVGTPTAGRTRPELKDLIGLFVNTLVLRTNLGGDPSFVELLGRVREVTLQAYAHQEIPFERLVEELGPTRAASHNPLFQAMFVLHSEPAGNSGQDGEGRSPQITSGTAKFDLTVSIIEARRGVQAVFEYNADLFEAATIERLAAHYGALVRSIAAEPSIAVSRLPIMDAAERRRIVYDWNQTATEAPAPPKLIPAAFAAQARRTPQATALVVDGAPTTYAELRDRTTRLAGYLKERGVGRETLVGVCMERSVDMVVALLAVLQAGGAYVPLDPDYPRDRVQFMLEDAAPQLVLIQERFADLVSGTRSPLVRVDADWPEIAAQGAKCPTPKLDGANLAYVIYTSGSTGRPKGAMNTHAAIANRLAWMQDRFQLTQADRVLQKTPTSFDVSVWELFWPLITGATMVLAEPGRHREPDYLIDLIGREKVTTAHFVPSALRAWLERRPAGRCLSLRRVIASGEELPADVAESFQIQLGVELHNLYGPTEAAIDVTAWECPAKPGRARVPIGRPIANTEIYVLDASLQPVAVGVPGELYIGGAGLGRGYLRRPALTAERFVPDPFGSRPGGRLYRTGDRARFRPDGNVEFLGRLDTQTKVRGFRVEVEEVESALRQHPAVHDAVVAARSYGSGDTRLVAYVVPDAGRAPMITTLLRYQREGRLADRTVAVLPNGLPMVIKNRAETEFVYNEIFEDGAYVAHGITLGCGDVVFDVGANVGLFEAFLASRYDGIVVYAFEPIPEVFALLELNVGLHGGQAKPFMCGISSAAGEDSFTYYPYVSILSGRYADAAEDLQAVLDYEQSRDSARDAPAQVVEAMAAERLSSTSVRCELKTVSQVMRECRLDHIDLLKIDAEKSEHEVLQGISTEDWPRIRQVVAEAHDVDGRCDWMTSVLTGHGFRVSVDASPGGSGTGRYMLYATRPDVARAHDNGTPRRSGETFLSREHLERGLRQKLGTQLPEYMVPSEFVLLEKLPSTPNGKLDRRSLPAPEHYAIGGFGAAYVGPRTSLEQDVARLVEDVLKTDRIGVRDNFFDRGGHSLLATRLLARIDDIYGVALSLRRFFEIPTVAHLAATIEELGDAALAGAQRIPRVASVPDGDREEGHNRTHPLSFAQRRLWFLDRFAPGDPTYHIPIALRLRAWIDTDALQRSIEEIVRRHDTLRTWFEAPDGEPVQVVASSLPITVGAHDLSRLAPTTREAEASRLAGAEAVRPFDLARGPLLRLTLLNLSDADHVLVVVMHHIVADGLSMAVFFEELSKLYSAFSVDAPSPLPELPIQYTDFASWQAARLEDGAFERELSHWQEKLSGLAPVLDLPTDRPRPAVRTRRGAMHVVALEPELLDPLRALSQRQGVTLFMTLLSALMTLLHRYTDDSDIAIGTPVANRTRPELEPLVGFFVNTLVLRADLSGDPTFVELLARVREIVLDAQDHQELPFEKLVEELNVERDPGRNPLFQVMFSVQTASGLDGQSSELNAGFAQPKRPEMPLLTTGTAKFDLTITVTDAGPASTAVVEYSTDLFDESTVAALVQRFRILLRGIGDEPSLPVSRLALLESAERAELALLVDGAKHDVVRPVEQAVAEHPPDATAVLCGDTTLTYGEIVRRADRLADRLVAHGVTPDARVGLLIDPGPELVVAALGVLRAGAVLVMFDPTDPPARRAAIAADAQCTLYVSSERSSVCLPDPEALQLALDDDELDVVPANTRPRVRDEPDRVCCLAYRSSASGHPEAVPVTSGGLATALDGPDLEIGPGDRVADTIQLADGSSYLTMFGALAAGATLVMLDVAASPRRTAAALRGAGATVVRAPCVLLERLGREFPWSLRSTRLILGDDWRVALAPELAERVRIPHGSLDTGGWWALASRGEPYVRSRPAGPQLHLLDAHGGPVPEGVIADLCLVGPGPSSRRTGDLARRRPGGLIELKGRRDARVTLRGTSIHLEEIERALRFHPGVEGAAVTLRDPGAQLIAYVVCPADGVTDAELATHAATLLPEAVLPALYARTDRLPTAEGRLDRRRLAHLDKAAQRAAASKRDVPPRTETEAKIARIWARTLGVDHPGVHDSFFELGGHSLLATRVLARINAAFAIDLPLRPFFEAPTIAAIAALVDDLHDRPAIAPQPRLERAPRDRAHPLSFAQRRLWFLSQLEPNSPFYNIPASVRLSGHVDVEALRASVNDLVARHESLRTTFPVDAGEPVQAINEALTIDLPLVQLGAGREEEARQLAAAEAQEPFDLAAGPLLRARLIALGLGDHVLLLTIHHIVSDGWSVDVLLRDLIALYEARQSGSTPALPALELQYADFSEWQRQVLTGPELHRQLDYWRHQLSGAPPLLELPTDRPRPAVQTFRGAVHTCALSAALVQRVKTLAEREGATLFMTLLAAFKVLLFRYTGQPDLVVGTPIANRTRPELEELIGFFANTLVLRTAVSRGQTFRELLARVRDVTLDAYTHQDLPFEKLVEELQPERSLAHNPLFQVMFTLQNVARFQPRSTTATARTAEAPTIGTGVAKFDLTVFAIEVPDGIDLGLEYNSDLFDASTVARMAGHFEILLNGAVTEPDRPIGALPMLSGQELLELSKWSTNDTPLRTETLHSMFEAQVRRTSDSAAVRDHETTVTYRELNERANRVAHCLARMGVKRDACVGICTGRSIETVVAVLAVLKAGGACVPLDPSYPTERLALMVADAELAAVLTLSSLVDRLPVRDGQLVLLDRPLPGAHAQDDRDPVAASNPDDLAYVLFTSGSTGRPKGVAMPHAPLANLVRWQIRRSDLRVGAPTLQFASLSFDVSFQEIFSTLCSGGMLVLISEEQRRDPDAVLTVIAAERVQRLFMPYVALKQLAEGAANAADLPDSLHEVITAGEQLHVTPPIRELFTRLSPCKLFNQYGPSETHVVTEHELRGPPLDWPASPPIGRPVPNAVVRILDGRGQPLGVGLPGGLYVGGLSQARGYLNHPTLTADRFLPDPEGASGARVYRTGDRARYLADGSIEFLGREDDQVKVRGFRVEPGEIEALLDEHPDVRTCAVIAHDDDASGHRLTAYVQLTSNDKFTAEDLRSYLRAKLPDHMVPSAFMRIDTMPLTPSGKLDRRRLPSESVPDVPSSEFVAPRTPTEQALTRIWCDLLGLTRISVRDNFFDRGGHSLLATRVIARINDELHCDVPLQKLFELPTIEQLSQWLFEATLQDQDAELAGLIEAIEEMSDEDVRAQIGY